MPSAEAAELFLRIAETSDGRGAHGAITAAVLADSARMWRQLLAIVRDSADRPRATRHDALFWVGRFTAAKTTGGNAEDLASVVDDDDDRDDPFWLGESGDPRGVALFEDILRR
ncbi:MAG: hypothetical protein ABI601_02860 [bacterium]